MTRREILVLLLAHREDALVAENDNVPSDRKGSRLLSRNEYLWCEAFVELERCLLLMRQEGTKAVKYRTLGGRHDGQYDWCRLSTARRHMLDWYTDVAHKLTQVRRKAKNGKRVTVFEPRPVRAAGVREDMANAGLTWLAQTYDFRKAYPGLHWLAKGQRLPGLRVEELAA